MVDKLMHLKVKLHFAKKSVEECRKDYLFQKKLLTEAEDKLVEAREYERRAREDLESYENEYVIESSVDDERSAQIAGFRERMPETMKKLENDPPIRPVGIGDLDTESSPGYIRRRGF